MQKTPIKLLELGSALIKPLKTEIWSAKLLPIWLLIFWYQSKCKKGNIKVKSQYTFKDLDGKVESWKLNFGTLMHKSASMCGHTPTPQQRVNHNYSQYIE